MSKYTPAEEHYQRRCAPLSPATQPSPRDDKRKVRLPLPIHRKDRTR